VRDPGVTSPAGSPITGADLASIRGDAPVTARGPYLNAGTLGPLPTVAIDAMARVADYDRDRRQGPDLWSRLDEHQRAARGAVASLTGVSSEQVALMPSTHAGINSCLWGLGAARGDSVVTTSEEHPGVTVPLRHLRDRVGIDARVATWSHDGDEAWVASVLGAVDATTRAVVVSHVSWVSGAVAPLRALRAALPPGVRIIVDGAQSAGVLGVDPTDGWDAYTVSGQKWPCGPNGSGGLALVDPEAWLPTFGGFAQVADPMDAFAAEVATDGRRLESSQESMLPLAGFAAGAAWVVETIGLWRAEAHARLLNALARDLLHGAEGVGELSGDAHLLCVHLPGGTAEQVAATLGEGGFVVRSLGPGIVRLSFGAWSSVEDVTSCVEAISRAVRPGP
jgi:L-cysteine/cystine lyase